MIIGHILLVVWVCIKPLSFAKPSKRTLEVDDLDQFVAKRPSLAPHGCERSTTPVSENQIVLTTMYHNPSFSNHDLFTALTAEKPGSPWTLADVADERERLVLPMMVPRWLHSTLLNYPREARNVENHRMMTILRRLADLDVFDKYQYRNHESELAHVVNVWIRFCVNPLESGRMYRTPCGRTFIPLGIPNEWREMWTMSQWQAEAYLMDISCTLANPGMRDEATASLRTNTLSF